MQTVRGIPGATFAALALMAVALGACSPRPVEGRSQVVDGLKFDYGLVAAPAAGGPPSSHPDLAMHGGAPSQAHAYHVVLAVADAKTGRKVEAAGVGMGLSGPGHPGTNITPMELMSANGQPTYARYIVLPSSGAYQLEFRITPAGKRQPVKARFSLQRPA